MCVKINLMKFEKNIKKAAKILMKYIKIIKFSKKLKITTKN